ncbi:MAG TPA: uroporphyrinogen-III synthase [Candidatus Paceibacterota bacterium]|nr:uroporphyrinogen-III synthase [Candidatus Paceibacterota bacterium]
MQKVLEIRVKTKRIPLSRASIQALRDIDRYDLVVFTSRHARKFFTQALRQYAAQPPLPGRVVQVGPRADLLKLPLDSKRVLFPRSAAAPYDIVRKMRRRGAVVRVVRLYTPYRTTLSPAQKRSLLAGAVEKICFRSPSGINGLLDQVPHSQRKTIFAVRTFCIGETTARAARAAGFQQVSVKGYNTSHAIP